MRLQLVANVTSGRLDLRCGSKMRRTLVRIRLRNNVN
jgi:hypothetical protein